MDIIAEAKYIRMGPRKVRGVVDAVKHLAPNIALLHLGAMPRRAAAPIAKVLKSALANATNNAKIAQESLSIKSIVVSGGPALKRWRPVSRGRAHPYKKRMSHIRIVLTDNAPMKSEKLKVKSEKKGEKNGTEG